MADTVPPEQRMANQIAANFRHVPADQAAEAIAGHVRRFWDPRMRSRLFELVDAGAGSLDPVVVAAAQLLRQPQGASAG
ncbi:formate dehydrogenase subunit delta [Streptomyces sp. NPDC051104]|uniref:formate dehydrogenase subunit delta n=1 Tax=Streptomyces sp. NPDC051104 TaxID=3155044 RepID=UPI00342E451E